MGRAVLNVVFAAAVLAALGLVAGPHLLGYRTITILSGSMAPHIEAGDIVVSSPVPAATVRRGDVITFHAPIDGAPLVTHRVLRVVERDQITSIRTKGDANASADPWVAQLEGDEVWRVRFVVPVMGDIVQLGRSRALQAPLLYGSLGLLVLVGLRSIWAAPARPEA